MRRVSNAMLLLLMVMPSAVTIARTLDVGPGAAYANLQSAAADVRPGDTILFHPGVHAGGEYVANLQGTADAWITIAADPAGEVILRGGGNSWQLSDPAYLRIEGFIIEGQT